MNQSAVLVKVYDIDFKEKLKHVANPYGTSNPSTQIIEELKKVDLEHI